MNMLTKLKLIGITSLLAAGLTACDKPGPAETAGKKIDQTVDDAGREMSKAAEKVGDKLDQQGDKAEVVMDDAAITGKVKAAIFAEPGLKTLQISVDTVKGVVSLSGSVNSLANSDRAQALAGAVDGVVKVENHLALKSIIQ